MNKRVSVFRCVNNNTSYLARFTVMTSANDMQLISMIN